ncbi:MAG TPA: hypothetical protein VHQ92_13775 [Pseudolabrys sp.]|jgi:hypothetical protein|nr:hypothetical protein [Pseudolabrys sp.]
MATEITARAEHHAPDAPDDGDYETFCAALSASARGRAFLTEYTRRNRNADTEQLLAAIAQLQQTVAANAAPRVTDTIKAELRALLDEIAVAQTELEASIFATKATKLADLVALVARRITAIMALTHAESLPPAEVTQPSFPQESKDEPKDAVERAHLAVVPTPEQPELPIPSPLVTPLPAIALVRSEMMMEEIAFVGPLSPVPDLKSATIKIDVPKIEAAISPPVPTAAATKPLTPTGPLASIMALSEEERLALFT